MATVYSKIKRFGRNIRKVINEMGLFLQRQVVQMQDGGMHAVYRKVNKTCYLLFMNIFASLAVYFKINWLKAYYFIGKKNYKKLKKLRSQLVKNDLIIKKVENRAIRYLKMVVDQDFSLIDPQEWMDASWALASEYFYQGKIEEMNDMCQKDAKFRRTLARMHQFDSLDIEFLPRYLPVGSIGNYEHLDAYVKAGILGLRPSKKMILLVDPKSIVINPCYLDCWRSQITVITDPALVEMLTPLEKQFSFPLNLYMVLREKMHKSFLAMGTVREQWINEKRPPLLKLPSKDYQRGWDCLKSLGLPEGAWFVCLHVRESASKDGGTQTENFRSSNIETYIPAIKAVTDAGGWVVRIGDPGMSKLPAMPNTIDYAHCDVKSDWMDIFLCAQCRFMIGTSSGMFNISLVFGVPVVMTNLLPVYALYNLTSRDLFIPRLCWSRDNARYLNYKESISPPVGMATSQDLFDDMNIRIVENSAEEITELVEEMLTRCDGAFKYSDEDQDLQKQFSDIAFDSGKLYKDADPILNARIG